MSHTCRHVGSTRSRLYSWKSRYGPHRLVTLERRPSRPRRVRQRQWTAAQVEAVRQARDRYPCWRNQRLAVILAGQQVHRSASTIGRILTGVKRRQLLLEPRRIRATPHARHPRPHAQCQPKGHVLAQAVPGALVQLEPIRRYLAPGVRPEGTALPRYRYRRRLPYPHAGTRRGQRTRCRHGGRRHRLPTRSPVLACGCFACPSLWRPSRSMGGASSWPPADRPVTPTATRQRVLPPRSPNFNGHVERSRRAHREECCECYDGGLNLAALTPALGVWEEVSNTFRPYHALGPRAPAEFLTDHPLSKRS